MQSTPDVVGPPMITNRKEKKRYPKYQRTEYNVVVDLGESLESHPVANAFNSKRLYAQFLRLSEQESMCPKSQ
jgi:hypothetical protein